MPTVPTPTRQIDRLGDQTPAFRSGAVNSPSPLAAGLQVLSEGLNRAADFQVEQARVASIREAGNLYTGFVSDLSLLHNSQLKTEGSVAAAASNTFRTKAAELRAQLAGSKGSPAAVAKALEMFDNSYINRLDSIDAHAARGQVAADDARTSKMNLLAADEFGNNLDAGSSDSYGATLDQHGNQVYANMAAAAITKGVPKDDVAAKAGEWKTAEQRKVVAGAMSRLESQGRYDDAHKLGKDAAERGLMDADWENQLIGRQNAAVTVREISQENTGYPVFSKAMNVTDTEFLTNWPAADKTTLSRRQIETGNERHHRLASIAANANGDVQDARIMADLRTQVSAGAVISPDSIAQNPHLTAKGKVDALELVSRDMAKRNGDNSTALGWDNVSKLRELGINLTIENMQANGIPADVVSAVIKQADTAKEESIRKAIIARAEYTDSYRIFGGEGTAEKPGVMAKIQRIKDARDATAIYADIALMSNTLMRSTASEALDAKVRSLAPNAMHVDGLISAAFGEGTRLQAAIEKVVAARAPVISHWWNWWADARPDTRQFSDDKATEAKVLTKEMIARTREYLNSLPAEEQTVKAAVEFMSRSVLGDLNVGRTEVDTTNPMPGPTSVRTTPAAGAAIKAIGK